MKHAAKVLLALLILGSLIYHVNVHDLVLALCQLTLGTFTLLALWAVILIYVSALKWSYFLRALGTRMPVLQLFNLYLVGYFVNLILPSFIGGDAIRSWYAGKQTGQHAALTATILERYTGLSAMVILAVVFMWFVEFVTWQIKLVVVFVALGLALATVLALSPTLIAQLERLPKAATLTKHLRKIQDGFHTARRDNMLLAKAFVLSFAYHTFTIGNTVAAAWAVGWWDPPVQDLFVVVPLILLVGAVPITPGGLGIQEGAFYYFLYQLGATPAQAMGVAVVLRAKGYILALLGGLVWLRLRRKPMEQVN
jgi:glycosyltransferase 2 family protein